jgi:hypothetical protein
MPEPQPAFYPRLPTTFVADSEGFLVDPVSLEVEVRDDAGTVIVTRTALDLTEYPTGDRLGLGYFRALDYDPQDEAVAPDPGPGRRTLTWWCVLEAGGPELTWTTTTERLATEKPDLGVPPYLLVADLRDEGFTTTMLTDARAHVLIARATLYIERFTGRRFIPEPRTIRLNGRGGAILQLGEPVIALDPDNVRVSIEPYPSASSLLNFSRDTVRVYARHLTQRLRHPDDRENPKLELYYPNDAYAARGSTWERLTWPRGQQNVFLTGVFGYTDADGSPMGRTPELIKLAAMLFVRRELERVGSSARGDSAAASRVTSERTRDQAVSYAAPGSVAGGAVGSPLLGAFTGDPEIDTILASFRRQHSFGAV